MASIASLGKMLIRKTEGNALLKIEKDGGRTTTFVCQFNPDELSIGSEGKFTDTVRQGEDAPIIQYMGGSASRTELKLYFSTAASYEIKSGSSQKPIKEKAKDVSVYTNQLMSLVLIDGKIHRPPIVTFIWGSLTYSGFVEHADTKYLVFEKGGIPVQAEVKLRFVTSNLWLQETAKQNPKESPDRSKCIVLTSDSSIWDIAEKEYGDASYWKEIAKANHILNPLEVPVGTHLKVPALF